MIQFLKRKINKFIRRNFYAEIWHIGFIKAELNEILDDDFNKLSVQWLPPKKDFYYLADPFIIKEHEQLWLFAEDFNYYDKKGKINCLKLNKDNLSIEAEQIIIHNKSHFSYPFIYQEGQNYYMLPENSSANELALYKANHPMGEWKKINTIIKGKKIIDATLLFHNKTYWLFYNSKSKLHGDNSELHIAFSDSLDQDFTPHPQNPVKVDITSSRPAGKIIKIKNKLYRPAQDCSTSYGGALVINEIIRLSKTEYTEKLSKTISPIEPYIDGLHTINHSDGLFVIDGKKYQFHWNKIFVNILRRIRKRLI